MREEYERDLHHAWMILETDELYKEDYQMRMLMENAIPGLLSVRGQGKDDKSQYRYEISGKISVKAKGEKEHWKFADLENFMRQFIQVLYAVKNYLLDVNCLSLDPGHIYVSDEIYYFCYCPGLEGNILEKFHELTEYFVRETDYEQKEAVYLAYELHKASMEEMSPLEGPNGVRNAFVRATGIVAGQFAITNKAENPEILFRWADAQFSEEATYFSSWGPEGEGWEKAPEGTLGINGKQALYTVLDGVNNTGADTVQNLAMPNIALANRTSDFRLGQAVGGDDKSEERLYEAASKYYYPYAKEQTYPLMVMSAEDSAVVNEYKTAINAYVDEMITGFLAGTYDLDKDWDSYLAEFDALGLEDYLKVLQSAYDKVYK